VKVQKKDGVSINFYHVWIIWFAGLVRGAIAFGLIHTIESDNA